MLRFVIWGCGQRGKMLLKCIDKDRVVAYIDSDKELQGKRYEDIPIISFEEYLKTYRECFIILAFALSPETKRDIVDGALVNAGVKNWFLLERCPTELPHYAAKLPIKEMLFGIEKLDKNNATVIAGINLFATLLYEYMKTEGYNVSLYASKYQSDIVAEIKKDSYYKFVSDESISNNAKILITDRFLDATNKFNFKESIKFYRFPYLKKYAYKSLERFHNIHKGKRCFVVATGPSLKIKDLDTLYEHNEYSFSVNSSYKCFDQTKWRPNYWVMTDSGALDLYEDEILNIDVKYKFLSDRQNKIMKNLQRDDIFYFHDFYEYYEDEGPEFSDKLDEGFHYGQNVIYATLQLAVYMGFSEIYVIGADCEYKSNGIAPEEHFIPNYADIEVSAGLKNGYLDTEKLFISYKSAKNYCEAHKIRICNATRGGVLEILERVDFDDLF